MGPVKAQVLFMSSSLFQVLREWDRLNWELPVYLTNNFVAEVRFAASDDVWMSNSYGRDTCHITVGRFHALELEIKEYFT